MPMAEPSASAARDGPSTAEEQYPRQKLKLKGRAVV
jgi:hypothetical protein